MKSLIKITLATVSAALLTAGGLQARPGYNDYTPVAKAPARIVYQGNGSLVPNCKSMSVFTGPKAGYVALSCQLPSVRMTPACKARCAQNS